VEWIYTLGIRMSVIITARLKLGRGDHPPLACTPNDGKTLGLPVAVHEWKFVRGNGEGPACYDRPTLATNEKADARVPFQE
jgi:hypothetical protein